MRSPCHNCQYKDRDKDLCLELGCTKPIRFAMQDHLAAYTQCDIKEYSVNVPESSHSE
jgi:hypothetical protein